ncbi:MAG TPA: GlmU family protein [Cytophagaceae bacterium]
MNIVLFDSPGIRQSLLPLTFTRPISLIRIGILTIAEKWQKYLNSDVSFLTEEYLQKKYPFQSGPKNLYINGAVCPTPELIAAIASLKEGVTLMQGEVEIAYIGRISDKVRQFEGDITIVQYPWDIFTFNSIEIQRDFDLMTRGRKSAEIQDPHTVVYCKENVFVEEGAKIRASVLNAEGGPIYIGKNSEISEGSMIRGPFALCNNAIVNMGSKINKDTTIGPYCKVGGEVANAVLFAYSNKGHDGFVGNTVIGEWCNLGAGTSTSNLKNNYSMVQVYNYKHRSFVNSGRQFVGLVMGDHSKSSINTMFNTGTVVGVSANVFDAGFPNKFIPSFSWGSPEGFTTYKLDKAYESAERMMERRHLRLEEEDKEILKEVFEREIKNQGLSFIK